MVPGGCGGKRTVSSSGFLGFAYDSLVSLAMLVCAQAVLGVVSDGDVVAVVDSVSCGKVQGNYRSLTRKEITCRIFGSKA